MTNQANAATERAIIDAVVVGAGFAGMYMIHKLREQNLQVQAFEAGTDVGGTWYWNRYPGARCDVPSIEYSYSFDKELEQEWDWTEAMAGQPEILQYANHVAERFDLRRHIKFETRVTGARFDDSSQLWRISTDRGDSVVARFCIMATGCLSMPNTPDIDGAQSFQGEIYHTGTWPKAGVDLRGKRVAIIGTGSSGVQAIPVIAEQADHLHVFQRTPVYTLPAYNRPLKQEYRQDVKANYPQIREMQRTSAVGISGYGMRAVNQVLTQNNIMDLSEAERLRELERTGFSGLRNFADVNVDLDANEVACELYRLKVSQIINDPNTADGLKPVGYPLGCKRQVIDTDYYDAYNRDNVTLVDLRRSDIERITETGLRTGDSIYDFDILVYATGFDAMTGALKRMDIRGRDGCKLNDKWAHGPRAYLGLQVAGFPNLFTITGPGSPSVLSNMLVSIEQHVEWISDCISHMNSHQMRVIEATEAAQDAWIEHVNEAGEGTMFTAPSCNSWYLGANIPGKPRVFMPYVGGVGRYRMKCDDVVSNGYEGFALG